MGEVQRCGVSGGVGAAVEEKVQPAGEVERAAKKEQQVGRLLW